MPKERLALVVGTFMRLTAAILNGGRRIDTAMVVFGKTIFGNIQLISRGAILRALPPDTANGKATSVEQPVLNCTSSIDAVSLARAQES